MLSLLWMATPLLCPFVFSASSQTQSLGHELFCQLGGSLPTFGTLVQSASMAAVVAHL